jgi:acetyl-CoA carboxylase carboxyltransferase component
MKLAGELVVDAVVPGRRLRDELSRRYAMYAAGHEPPRERKRGICPV